MAVEIGWFRPSDAAACEAIASDVFAGLNIPYFLERRYGIDGYGSRMNAFWTRGFLHSAPDQFLVAREDGRAVGFAALSVLRRFGIGWLIHIGVHRERQNRGIGGRMVEAALTHFQKLGLSVAWIEYDDGNERAGYLYRKLGFREFGESVYFDSPISVVATQSCFDLREEPDARRLMSRLPAHATLFAEQELVRLHSLGVDDRALATLLLGARFGRQTKGYAVDWSEDRSFVVAGPEADGPVLHIAALYADEPVVAAHMLREVMTMHALTSVREATRPVAAYAEVYQPSSGTVDALRDAGFQRVHKLICLSKRL